MVKKLGLETLDDLNCELAFVLSTLEVIKILAFKELLNTVDDGRIAGIVCDAIDKANRIEETLNKEEA